MPPTNRARLARERAGLSIGQAVKHLGIEHERLVCVEESDVAFAKEDVADMAKAYGVRVEWLTGEVERYDYANVAKMKGAEELSFHDRDVIAEFAASMPRPDDLTIARRAALLNKGKS